MIKLLIAGQILTLYPSCIKSVNTLWVEGKEMVVIYPYKERNCKKQQLIYIENKDGVIEKIWEVVK